MPKQDRKPLDIIQYDSNAYLEESKKKCKKKKKSKTAKIIKKRIFTGSKPVLPKTIAARHLVSLVMDKKEEEAIQYVTDHPEILQVVSTDIKTSMIRAAELNLANFLSFMLKRDGVNPNGSVRNTTPLDFALSKERSECVKVLLSDKRVKAFEPDEYGYSQFDWAVRLGKLEMVKLFTICRPDEIRINYNFVTLPSINQNTMLFLTDFLEKRGRMD